MNKKDEKTAKADEPMKVQIVEPTPEPAPPPEPFPESEPIPAVKSPVTNTVVHTTERVKVKDIESGEESWMWPVDANEAVATGRFEIVNEGMAKQLPNDEVPTVVTGSTNVILSPKGPDEEDAKKSSSRKK
jgi:hypothetical protein